MASTINLPYQKTYLLDVYSSYSLNGVTLQISNTDVVSDMISNVIETSPGERPFVPQFGSGVYQLLFNNITVANANLILQEIFFSVQKYITFATINTQSSQVYADLANGIYYFVLHFTISGLPGTVSTTITLSPYS